MERTFPNKAAQAVVSELLYKARQAVYEIDIDLYKNKIDPFSALIDSMLQGITLSRWMTQEIVRQNQKTLQNCIGNFHQSIISSFKGWEGLGRGDIVDIRNKNLKVVAEVKNKFNTTKGNHKVQIYRDIEAILKQTEYNGFVGYYVEIIPSGRGHNAVYNKPFVPSDNTKKGQRVNHREDIRIIDGRSFYKIVTGNENALAELYSNLPEMIRFSLGNNKLKPEHEELFLELFNKAFE